MIITEIQKTEIREALERYVRRYGSQKKAAASLKGISEGTLSTILTGKFERIGDDMWSRLRSQVCPATAGYRLAETGARMALLGYFQKMKEDFSARLENPDLGVSMTISWSGDTLPILSQWRSMASGDYVLGLEPTN